VDNRAVWGLIVEPQNQKPKGSERNRSAAQDNPLSILREGPGKPSPHDAYLFDHRERLIWILEPSWHELGLALMYAQTPDDIRTAFGPISRNASSSLLLPIVRVDSEPSTVKSIQQVRKQLGNAVESERSVDNLHQVRLHSFQDAERRAFTLSDAYKKQLRDELVKRRENVRGIKIQIVNQKGQLRKAELRKQGEKELNTHAAKSDLRAMESALQALQHDCEADEKVCASLKKQIDLVTPEHRVAASEEVARRTLLLDATVHRLNEARRISQELEHKLRDQEAYFFRVRILAFIKDSRYTLTPRALSNAIAGLPHMTARRSAERCAMLKSRIPTLRNYKTLLFITSAWNRSGERGYLRLVEWFEREIKKMPKFRIKAKRRMPNEFRAYLCENWHHLREAIKESSRIRCDPRAMPHVIATNFLKRVSGTENPVEATMAEAERITD
jgi:hypothetical protein